ncbi:hypothetical protein BGZ83_001229 [Gryganskiella cystojenkinii]|nr:hypothetical protein BGZ83_001229 [Gryganskiella cystojenkinii]
MTDKTLNLFCLVVGKDTPFSVEISENETVDRLKKAIKLERANDFSNVDARNLKLWRVSILLAPLNERKPVSLKDIDSPEELDPLEKISHYFKQEWPREPHEPESPNKIDVIVERPLPDHKHKTSGDELRDDRDAKRSRSHIATAGPVLWSGPSFMLPFTERSLFKEVRQDLTAKPQELPPTPRHYVLMDEFQSVFRSSILLNAAKKFFRNLSSKTAVSYVAVGTYKLKELLLDDGSAESPFNKATFDRMPPFDLREMGKLFDLYKKHCDSDGISRQIQDRIVHESGGHPASFMALLKLVLQHQPDEDNWATLLQESIGFLLNENDDVFVRGKGEGQGSHRFDEDRKRSKAVWASKYAVFYHIPAYLVNFYLEGHSTPVPLLNIPANVFVVNIMHSKDCTRFAIAALNGNEITVSTNDDS